MARQFETMILPVILGPTCIGKTSLALEIAHETGCDILSIDSRQVFKELDIGTGKYKGSEKVIKGAGFWEVAGVKIWGYDLFFPNEELNVLKYCEFARQVITKYQEDNKKLIATCGTGFYLDFLAGRIEFNQIDEVRKKDLHNKSNQELSEILSKYETNPQIDSNNNLRVITRILSHESPSKKQRFLIPGLEFKIFYLTEDRVKLYQNSDKFTQDILQNGVIQEYQTAFKGFGECKSLNGLIYKDIFEYLFGKLSLIDLEVKIKFSLHAYIRRQQTYFKKMKIDFSSFSREEVAYKIKEIL